MSQGPQDFSSFDEHQFGDQYRPPGTPPRKKSNLWIWVLLACVGGGFFLLCCGGGIGAMYFGLGVISAELETEIRDHPAIQEHIGEIEDISMNITKSSAEADDEVFVFDVEGPNGTGTVTAKMVTQADGSEDIQWATLRTADGQTIELIPSVP